eukprot:Gb_16577 [translate_table: standard]
MVNSQWQTWQPGEHLFGNCHFQQNFEEEFHSQPHQHNPLDYPHMYHLQEDSILTQLYCSRDLAVFHANPSSSPMSQGLHPQSVSSNPLSAVEECPFFSDLVSFLLLPQSQYFPQDVHLSLH